MYELYPEMVSALQKENVAIGDSIIFDKKNNKVIKTKENSVIKGAIMLIDLDPNDQFSGKIHIKTPYGEQ